MRTSYIRWSTLATGMLVTGALGLLAHCGGGSNGASPVASDPPSTSDGGVNRTDASTQAAAHPIPCDTHTPCTAGGAVTCCGGFCVDISADPANCGSCGNSCSSGQFCDGTGCDQAIIANVCHNPRGTVVLDQIDVDDMAGIAVGEALSSHCMPAPKIVQLSQDAGGVVDPGTGRPTTGGGNTFIAGGGAFGQRAINYIELSAPVSPVYLHTDGTTAQIIDRASGASIVNTKNASLNEHHDFFYIQLAVEPESGTLTFAVEGINGPGTQAAAYYVSSVIMPNLSTYTKSWYVFEWTDANNDSLANNGDTFTMDGSGP
jgi:Stigma-specific protein, Stig1